MIRKTIKSRPCDGYKLYNTGTITEIKLWGTYLNGWADRIFIATQRPDGLFVGYTYGNPQPYLFTPEGAFAGYIDLKGIEHTDKRPDSFDLRFFECAFTPWNL